MIVKKECSLSDFEFWAGAVYTYDELSGDDLEVIESVLEDCYPEGIDATALNDLFWFDKDTIADWLGYEDWEQLEHWNNRAEDCFLDLSSFELCKDLEGNLIDDLVREKIASDLEDLAEKSIYIEDFDYEIKDGKIYVFDIEWGK